MRLLDRLLAIKPVSGRGADEGAIPPPAVEPVVQLQGAIASMAVLAPADAAKEMVRSLPRLFAGERDPYRRLALVDRLREHAEGLLQAIERTTERAALPLSRSQSQAALSADNLLKFLAAEYQAILASLTAHPPGARAMAEQQASLHATHALVRRQWLACRAGKTASQATWARLHRQYRLARDGGFATVGNAKASIESHYRDAVLLALATPTSFARADLGFLLSTIRRLSPRLRLLATPEQGEARQPALAGFPAPATGAPVAMAIGPDPVAGYWRADLTEIINALQADIHAGTASRLPDGAVAEAPRRVLERLLENLRRQPLRRFSRQSMRPRVDMIIGLDRLWWALSGPGASRRQPGARPVPQGDGAVEWTIVDESPSGFGLCLIHGSRPEMAVGDIVGVGLRDIGRLHLCIVRRIDDDTRWRCRVGVQLLAANAAAVLVYGQDPSCQEMAIRLTGLPAHAGRPGLVALSDRLQQGCLVREVDDIKKQALLVGKAVESNGRYCIHLIESLR